MKFIILLLFLMSALQSISQDNITALTDRLKSFGTQLPQEQVFLHMDNTCYYLGDTIYYKAYVARGDNGKPSNISGILYCELLNHDGYLVERQMIALDKGEGHGNFALTDSLLYAGYYEIRAYTRWQLNWGVTEYPHSHWAEEYFFSKQMADDYYRDYEKLYSRVFPVYDKPRSPGNFIPDMTLRPLANYYKTSTQQSETHVQFFPEGGALVAGVKQRVAWEARNEQGMALEGTLTISHPNGTEIASTTQNRGRGVFEIEALEGEHYDAVFSPHQGGNNPTGTLSAKVSLPKTEVDGVSLRVETDTFGIMISWVPAGGATTDTLALTVMHNGVLHHSSSLHLQESSMHLPLTETGVYQVTVFNSQGRVYADRLCFYMPANFSAQNIAIKGLKDGFIKAFDAVTLELEGQPNASMSVAVRDAAKTEFIYDTGNMLTEQLLASQIRGFVPHPQWFFQKDEPIRRCALDLLMMVQGWRKYSWREMAIKGEFQLRYMPESRYPHWEGEVNNYSFVQVQTIAQQEADNFVGQKQETTSEENIDKDKQSDEDSKEDKSDPRARFNQKEENLKYPVALHAEFSQPGNQGVEGDMRTTGRFSIDFPRYYGEFFFFLGASDTTKWKKGQAPIWTQNGRDKHDELEAPEYYVKLNPIFPRFPHPYDYYQSHIAPMPKDNPLYNSADEQVRMLSEIVVGAKRNGRRRFGHWKPAFVLDAYDAFNATCDAGFTPGYFMGAERFGQDVARTYIGDMKRERKYDVGYRLDGIALTDKTDMQRKKQSQGVHAATSFTPIPESIAFMPASKQDKYNFLWNISDVVIYTDYSPRNDNSQKYKGNDLPSVTIDIQLLKDGEERSYQKNRRWKMKGFSVPDEFYSPDYSKTPLPQADYRRTLYWNPNVKLDADGKAQVQFYNNSTPTILQISAEGWIPEGIPQCGNLN